MRTMLSGGSALSGSARRWSLAVGLLVGLAAFSALLATQIDAQRPQPPHWFWGDDLDSYQGDQIQAIGADGEVIDSVTIDPDGGWFLLINPSDTATVTFRLISDEGDRETAPRHVIGGEFDLDGISIADFSNVVEEVITETLDIRIIARLREDRTPRTFEFNIRVDGVDVDPAPRLREHRPSLERNRWYRSSLIDAGDGYLVRVIACRQDDQDMLFGVRVEGHDDIIPSVNRIRGSLEHNRWLRSNEFAIPMPRDNDGAIRLGVDDDCSASALDR